MLLVFNCDQFAVGWTSWKNKSEAEDNLSRGTNGLKASQNPEDLGSSAEAEDEVDELEEGNEKAMAASNCEPDLILLYDKEISSLNTEALKAELNRRRLKKSGNKRTLVERLRAAKTLNISPKRSETTVKLCK